MAFKVLCECGNSQTLLDGEVYEALKEGEGIDLLVGPVGEDGVDLVCNKCRQKIQVNNYEEWMRNKK